MDRNTEVTLDQITDGVVATLAAQFPGVHVEAYRMDRKDLPVPTILVELDEFEDADMDPGTGQLAVTAMFSALVVMHFRQPDDKNPKREVRNLAAAVAAFARLQRWGCPIGPATVTGAHPDDFHPELDQYEVWAVEWRQIVHLGETVWKGGNPPPDTVVASFAPMIGGDFETDYQQVTP